MIDTTYQVISVVNDTLYMSIDNVVSNVSIPNSSNSYLKILLTIIAAVIGSIIGALVTIWSKKKEFKNFQENLNLQKQIFEETKLNNENQIKAELVRLKDLRNQYDLSLKRFDLDHLKEVLDFADDKNEKAQMMKSFTSYLQEYNPIIPAYVQDHYEYQEFVVYHIYDKLEKIQKNISRILTENPSVFVSLHSDFNSVAGDAGYLLSQSIELLSYRGVTAEQVINELFESLFKLHENLNGLLDKMQEEFHDLDRIKKDFIKSQFSKGK